MTADPFKPSASSLNPMSWNRYSYVLGDPINYNDPRGLECEIVGNTLTANPSKCDASATGSVADGNFTVHINVTDQPGNGDSSEEPPPDEPSDEHPSLVPPSLGPFVLVNQGGGPSSGGASNPPKNCPSVPAHPANANVNANMAQTNAAKPIPLVGGSDRTAFHEAAAFVNR